MKPVKRGDQAKKPKKERPKEKLILFGIVHLPTVAAKRTTARAAAAMQHRQLTMPIAAVEEEVVRCPEHGPGSSRRPLPPWKKRWYGALSMDSFSRGHE
jgi:hypothetical protein